LAAVTTASVLSLVMSPSTTVMVVIRRCSHPPRPRAPLFRAQLEIDE
jgi:hypothetical protein